MKLTEAGRKHSMMSIKSLAMRDRADRPGRHRRRGLLARLRVAQAVRVRTGRVLGAGAVIAVLTIVCVTSALGLTHSGGGGIPSFQKPNNPFLNNSPGGGTAGNPQPTGGTVLRLSDAPVPASASVPSGPFASGPTSVLTLPPPSATATPHESVSPSSYPSPAPSASPSGPASPAPSPSPSSHRTPAPSASPSGSASPSPSGY